MTPMMGRMIQPRRPEAQDGRGQLPDRGLLVSHDLLAFLDESQRDDGQDLIGHRFVQVQGGEQPAHVIAVPSREVATVHVPEREHPAKDLLGAHSLKDTSAGHPCRVLSSVLVGACREAVHAGVVDDHGLCLDLLGREPGQEALRRHQLDPLLPERFARFAEVGH